MKACAYPFVLGLINLLPLITWAQSDSSASKVSRKNVFTASVNYQSRLSYYGRTDSLRSGAFYPSIGYQLKMGLYAQANFFLLNNSSKSLRYAGTTAEGGWKFGEGKKLSGNVFYTRFLYQSQSKLVQSALKSQTGLNLAWETSMVTFNLGGDIKFSGTTDYGASAGLDHLFLIRLRGKSAALGINPSAYVYAGTQHFIQTYYQENKILTLLPGPEQPFSRDVQQFNVLSYEISLPVVLVLGKVNCSLTGAYVIPQHLVMVPGRADLSENGRRMFYVSLGTGVRL